MSDHMMIGSLRRTVHQDAGEQTEESANGSASSAVRNPISRRCRIEQQGAGERQRQEGDLSAEVGVMVSELHSRTKSPWRHSPLNARAGFSRRNRFAIVFPLSLARYQKSRIVKLPNSGAIHNFSGFLAQFGFSSARSATAKDAFSITDDFLRGLPDASGDPAGRGVRAE